MAGVPCVNDTCSIISTVDSGRLNLDVRVDADGGLVCTDGQGLGVLLDPSTSNKLSLSTAGLLGPGSGHQLTTGLGGTVVAFPVSAQTSDSANFTIVNSSATESRLVILHSKLQYQFTVTDDEWSTDGTLVLNVDGSSISESFTIGGADNTPAADASDDKVHAAHITVFRTLGPAAGMQVRAYGSGRSEEGNFTSNQMVAFVDVLVVDSPQVSGLFTIT